ncbi:CGNR zinc finger domain-containing protein [Vagococcus carniphilus]|uniref:CGNR zinc finger domain-containing protein n=1 Tax=Vagococcus carniphilus TaxID=218144 RepID=UPI00288D5DA6|nr:CGNR zinc finger domain-containing protein [Vagococcus carniphilus]MDT2848388.1 CGNR zinc finger domain-containing protein [Vagococcus carniphilus]
MQSSFPNVTTSLALNFLNSKLVSHGKIIDLIDSKDSLRHWAETPHQKDIEYNLQLSIFNSCLDQIEDVSPIIAFRNDVQGLLFEIINEEKSVFYLKNMIEENLINNPLSVIFVESHAMYVPAKDGLEGIKSIILLSLIDLIETGQVDSLKRCDNPECFSVFSNKSGRRKWCSMKICGNRNKVEQFEKRRGERYR